MNTLTDEEKELLTIAEQLGRLMVRLRALDRLSESAALQTLIQQLADDLSFSRSQRLAQERFSDGNLGSSPDSATTSGTEDLATVSGSGSLSDRLSSFLGPTR